MPEGDTIYRTATTLRRWLAGREVTAAYTRVLGLPAARLIGATVTHVESQGKHLLVRFSNGVTLHTHMRMTGSWHVYPAGERWRLPEGQARLVLEAGNRVAVCFNAPVIEVLSSRAERMTPGLSRLGQDLLGPRPLDVRVVVGRARRLAEGSPLIGELLLDQRVVAGIGNIYRCESLFLCAIDPWASVSELTDIEMGCLFTTAAELLRASASAAGTGPSAAAGAFDTGPGRRWVYRRAGRPCRRCGAIIRSRRLGRQARSVYWCPGCQPPRPPVTADS